MCQHPNIIKLMDVFESHAHYYIVLEYMQGSDLFEYMQKRAFNVSENRVKTITKQIAEGLIYLHNYGIMHRDLKLENIMMSDTSDTATIKLVDFGLSKFVGPNGTSSETYGTIGYVAPEVLKKEKYGFSCDMWGLGCIVYSLLCGCLPFDDEDQKETIRQTINDPLVFDSACWN